MNKTEIFENYTAFLERADKKTNGVSKEFAEANPEFEAQNGSNEGCWNCRDCSDCSDCRDCRDCSSCSYCSYCSDCRDCRDCSSCSYCSYCSDCRYCRDCSDCSDCRDCRDCSSCSSCSDCSSCSEINNDKIEDAYKMVIPKIENIHQKILEAVSKEGALNMSTWHTCDTTHCRAGWVVVLAGEAGRKLESQTSTEFAAKQIYKESSNIPVSPVKFFLKNEESMADIIRCAEEEKASGNI